MLMRRLLPAAGLVALVIALAALVGWPDPGGSLELLSGASVTTARVSALIVVLCWLAVAILAVAAAVASFRSRHRRQVTTMRDRSLAALALGLTMLGIGLARHEDGYRVCCASSATTQQVQQLVH